MASAIRAFRFGYPALFPTRRLTGPAEDLELAPVEDWQFEIARAETAAFRNAETHLDLRALLVLGRGAGLGGLELRYTTGSHIGHVPAAGTWVEVTAPNEQRRVPILARLADLAEDLAVVRSERCMIANGPAPCDPSQAGHLAGVLSRSLRRHGHGFRINTEGLRKAWLVEQVASNTPIPTFQAADGLKSLRSLERLVPYAPRPPASPVHLAYELGGIEAHEDSRRS